MPFPALITPFPPFTSSFPAFQLTFSMGNAMHSRQTRRSPSFSSARTGGMRRSPWGTCQESPFARRTAGERFIPCGERLIPRGERVAEAFSGSASPGNASGMEGMKCEKAVFQGKRLAETGQEGTSSCRAGWQFERLDRIHGSPAECDPESLPCVFCAPLGLRRHRFCRVLKTGYRQPRKRFAYTGSTDRGLLE